MKILSLYDGISCGLVAFNRANIIVDDYVAYEIDPKAIKISEHHFPEIDRRGNVFDGKFKAYEGFDIVIGGSPCTFWSVARTNKGRETTSDGEGFALFLEFVRALHETKARYFIYENNFSIHKDIKAEITRYLGVDPILINSSLVSAQNRKRLYWTNIEGVTQPKDENILLQDIITSGVVDRKKSLCIARRTVGNRGSQDYLRRRYFGKSFAQMVFENCDPQEQKALFKKDPYGQFDGDGFIRPLNILEMERLQTLPDDYTKIDGLSENDRGEAIGNGWTVDVIKHLVSFLEKEDEDIIAPFMYSPNMGEIEGGFDATF